MVEGFNSPIRSAERLERLPIVRWHRMIALLVGLIYMYESLDLGITGTVTVVLNSFPGHTTFFIALFGVSIVIGIVVGMVFAGPLTDRYGKRRVLLVGLLVLIGISGIITIIPENFGLLVSLRVIQGLGAGAVYAFPYPYLAEFIPKQRRGFYLGFIDLFFVFGYFLAPLIGLFVVPTLSPSISWRVVFALGFVPIVFYPLYYKYLPQSPRWLERKGRHEEADKIVNEIENTVRKQYGKDLPPVQMHEKSEKIEKIKFSYRELFSRKYLKYSIPLWVYTSAMLSGFYLSNVYGPKIFITIGYSSTVAFLMATIMNGVMLGPKAAVMFLVDRVGRKKIAMFLMIGASILSIVLYLYHYSLIFVVVVVMFIFWSANSNSPLWRMFSSETYPTPARGVGVYMNEIIARLWSGIIFTFIAGYVIVSATVSSSKTSGIYEAYLMLAVVSLIGFIAVFFLKETTKKTLEEIEYEIRAQGA